MKWTKLIPWGVTVVSLIILYFCCFSGCRKQKPDIAPTTNDSLQYWKNTAGELVASKKLTDEALAKSIFDLDSMAMLYNTKPKYIKEYVQVVSKTTDTIYSSTDPITIYQGDSIRMLSQMFESNYHIAEVTIDRLGDSSRLLISSVDTLDQIVKQVIEGNFWNRRRYVQFDIKNRNPNTLITQVNAYRQLLPKPKRFGIGIQGGYGFTGISQPKPYVGVGISYNLIRF